MDGYYASKKSGVDLCGSRLTYSTVGASGSTTVSRPLIAWVSGAARTVGGTAAGGAGFTAGCGPAGASAILIFVVFGFLYSRSRRSTNTYQGQQTNLLSLNLKSGVKLSSNLAPAFLDLKLALQASVGGGQWIRLS